MISSALTPHPSERAAWRRRFLAVRDQTTALAASLSPEDQVIQSMTDASPTKWHLAHTAWFFETFILKDHAEGYSPFDPDYAYLFNSYYEAVGERHPRPQRGLLSRPSSEEVLTYRSHVDAAMATLIEEASPKTWDMIHPLIELGLNHEQQHQELILMDIKHAFSINPLLPAYAPAMKRDPAPAPPLEWVAFPGGLYEIGHDGEGFAFDNEGPRHRVWLEPFALANRLTTNADYLAFIDDGGYQRPEFWLSDGWAARQSQGWEAPLYWLTRDGRREIFTLAGPRPLDLSEPVCHVSYYEADAFANWTGRRLAREEEWEAAASRNPTPPDPDGGSRLHPSAAADAGLSQMFGECWQWTSSAYSAYPGFRAAKGAIGEYNGKFMSNQFVLRGAAAVTPASHARMTYRNFFPPAARWAFSGIRLASDDV
ncbi:MAG: ergothioneine biosynthesis protein EgtB [Alphaproteobacteria bacterium]|nr:ergothioneine biosynthesis protein EgtB [Alphaproteobacteria bacterium]